MKFDSLEQLIELTNINSKAAECLGASGALSSLLPDMNEAEAARYAKDYVQYLREKKAYEEKLQKFREKTDQAMEKYNEELANWQSRMEEKTNRYIEKVSEWEKEVERREQINEARREAGKKELLIPERPKRPTPLKEIVEPNLTAPLPPEEIQIPMIPLSQTERLKNERDLLHIYISGHLLDLIPRKEGIDLISSVHLAKESEIKRVRGVLQNIIVKQTRSGNLMARLRIEDKTGSIEVVAFNRLYKSVRGSITEGDIYEILGRVTVSKSYSEEDEQEVTYSTLTGLEISPVKLGPTTEWEVTYPVLAGYLRILPGLVQKNKGIATSILVGLARGTN